MAKYSVEFSATSERQLRKLDRTEQVRILRAVRDLAAEPYPRGARKLQGYEDVFRIRAGTFRIIYSVESVRLLIIVLKIGPRKDVYR